MKNIDKFLVALVVGIVILIGVALTVVLLRPKPAYQAEDTPAGVAYNYLLALKREDYTRAYGYLSHDLAGYPETQAKFTTDIKEMSYYFFDDDSTSLNVSSSDVTGDWATVTVEQTTFYSGGLFNSNHYTSTFDMTLLRDSQGWKIGGSESYWAWCWGDEEGCQ